MELGPVNPTGRSISYCVNNFISESGDYETIFFSRYGQMAIDCVQYELQMFSLPSVKVAYLPIPDSGIVMFPGDCVKYLKIGIDLGGKMWTLTMNRDILIPKAQECGVAVNELRLMSGGSIPPAFGSAGGYYFTGHYRNGQFVGGLYGIGGGLNVGYYNIDEQGGRIILTPNLPRKMLVVEYLSSGVNQQTIVPHIAVQAIKAYIRWKRDIDDTRVSDGTKNSAERRFYEEVEKMRTLLFTFQMDEYLDSLFESVMPAPNR